MLNESEVLLRYFLGHFLRRGRRFGNPAYGIIQYVFIGRIMYPVHTVGYLLSEVVVQIAVICQRVAGISAIFKHFVKE